VLDFFGLAHFHAPVLRLPGIDRVLAHALFPRNIFGRAPVSTCFSAPIICASVCRLLLIVLPLAFGQIVFQIGLIQGARSQTRVKLWRSLLLIRNIWSNRIASLCYKHY
jgi:hypothetical protein